MDSELYNIGKVVNTDKIYHHGYHRFYESIIKKDISKILTQEEFDEIFI